jgi:hypothetical protein
MAEKCGSKRAWKTVTISGKYYHLRSRGADNAEYDGKPKIRAGEVRPVAAVQRRGGRKPTERKKTQIRTFAFFSTLQPPATAGGCPSPFEPLRDGFATGTERSGVERANPSYVFERGKPGGEGEGQYMPPLYRRLSTLGVKVARLWAGIVGRVPHGACFGSELCYTKSV